MFRFSSLLRVKPYRPSHFCTVGSYPFSVADPHRKNSNADPGKNLNADADADSCLLMNYGELSNGIRNL